MTKAERKQKIELETIIEVTNCLVPKCDGADLS